MRVEPNTAANPTQAFLGASGLRDRILCWQDILSARLRELVLFDSPVARFVLAVVLLLRAGTAAVVGNLAEAWRTLFRVHRAALNPGTDRLIDRIVVRAVAEEAFAKLARSGTLAEALPPLKAAAFNDPRAYPGSRLLVLKAAMAHEKGVVLMNYAAAYTAFLRLFDADAISERYYIVLETAWCGTCDENILPFAFLRSPVFVQTNEPRDLAFLRKFPGQLIPVETASNWWVAHDVFKPRPEVSKDTDLIMIAAWASFKRHHELFRALQRLRRRGRTLSVLLVGYRGDRTLDDIWQLACFYGVQSQLECHEDISGPAVAHLINRARANVVWSRREGSNRAIVEGFLSGVPGVMRAGFNYGYRHPYMNPMTGTYATESQLPAVLDAMVTEHESYDPRSWVMSHMSWRHAQRILERRIAEEAARRGEPWSGGMAGHFGAIGGGVYVDPADAARFEPDHEYLAAMTRKPYGHGNPHLLVKSHALQ